MQDGERIILREKFAGKMATQTEKQLQQQADFARTAGSSNMGAAEKVAKNAVHRIKEKAIEFEKELVTGGTYRLFSLSISSSLGNKTVAGSDRSCISSASFGIQII
jgi:hypothetical protein